LIALKMVFSVTNGLRVRPARSLFFSGE